jgi:uncharacterized hydrophobic protein (TIGR00271 family)
MSSFKLKKRLELNIEDSVDSIVEEVIDGAKMNGANLWLLIIATIIACIGLVNNSVTAVIGAMLISPLMGPIVGLGTGLAMQDRRLVKIVFQQWIWLILVSLSISILFFLISPYNFLTKQITAFTQATIYDVLLAFVGGIAGFVGIVKSEGAKILAGVAVATSCVPPLAVCGYGILHFDWQIALGGLYYYLVNCSFIALGTYLTAIYLKLPKKTVSFSANYYKTLWLINVIFLLPAGYIMYKSYIKIKTASSIENVVNQVFKEENILKFSFNNEENELHLTTTSSGKNNEKVTTLKNKLANQNLKNIKLDIHFAQEDRPQINQDSIILSLEKRIKLLEQK